MVSVEVKERVGYILLQRLEKKNALNPEFIQEIKSALKSLEIDSNVKVVIFKSDSDVFCAGADLEYILSLQENSYEDNIRDSANIRRLFEYIYDYPKVTIAQVEGHAIAGGCGIANACDFCFATDNAKFGYSEVKIGFIPALVSVYLVKKIGESKARELLLTGKLVQGEEAVRYGLVNECILHTEIDKYVFNFAKNIADSTSAMSIEHTKKLLIQIQSKSLEEAFNIATEYNAKMRETNDFKKGVRSFVEKTKLSW